MMCASTVPRLLSWGWYKGILTVCSEVRLELCCLCFNSRKAKMHCRQVLELEMTCFAFKCPASAMKAVVEAGE